MPTTGGRLSQRTDPGVTVGLAYHPAGGSAAGLVASVSTFAGTSAYVYDDAGRPVSRSDAAGHPVASSDSTTFTTDATGASPFSAMPGIVPPAPARAR